MKKRLSAFLIGGVLVIVSAFLNGLKADDTIPHGTWEVNQVKIEKSTDRRISIAIYSVGKKIESYIACPQIWEVRDSSTLVRHHLDGTEELTKYTLDGNQMKVDLAVEMQCFDYKLNTDNLTLLITYFYVNNLANGRTEQIEEKWTIDLKRKK